MVPHLAATTARPSRATAPGSGRRGHPALLLTVLGAGLAGSAVVHASVVAEHLKEWPAAGWFFVALAAAELGLAAVLVRRRGTRVLVVVAALSIGPLVLWLWSRTLGLPFGPEPGMPEAVGTADLTACALEVLTLLVAAALLRRGKLMA